jgi:hypothetical protein
MQVSLFRINMQKICTLETTGEAVTALAWHPDGRGVLGSLICRTKPDFFIFCDF